MKVKMFALLPRCSRRQSDLRSRHGRNCRALGTNWVAITSGFAMAIASAVCGMAQAKAVAASVEGMARKSRRGRGHPVRAASRTGADRITGALHGGYNFRQGSLAGTGRWTVDSEPPNRPVFRAPPRIVAEQSRGHRN